MGGEGRGEAGQCLALHCIDVLAVLLAASTQVEVIMCDRGVGRTHRWWLTRRAGMVRSCDAMATACRCIKLGFLPQDRVPCFLPKNGFLEDAAGSWRRMQSTLFSRRTSNKQNKARGISTPCWRTAVESSTYMPRSASKRR